MRYIATLIVLAFFITNSFSQVRTGGKEKNTWLFQMGPTIGVLDGPASLDPMHYGLILEPKYIFGQMGRESSISLGFPIKALFFSESKKKIKQYEGISANIPVVMDFNFYHAAFKRSKRRLGAFIGFGWDFNYMHFLTSNPEIEEPDEDVSGLNHGPYFNGGFRIKLASAASIDIRGYGSIAVNRGGVMVAGVALLYNFGMSKKAPGSKGGWF